MSENSTTMMEKKMIKKEKKRGINGLDFLPTEDPKIEKIKEFL
jgi:hypothetical protein